MYPSPGHVLGVKAESYSGQVPAVHHFGDPPEVDAIPVVGDGSAVWLADIHSLGLLVSWPRCNVPHRGRCHRWSVSEFEFDPPRPNWHKYVARCCSDLGGHCIRLRRKLRFCVFNLIPFQVSENVQPFGGCFLCGYGIFDAVSMCSVSTAETLREAAREHRRSRRH